MTEDQGGDHDAPRRSSRRAARLAREAERRTQRRKQAVAVGFGAAIVLLITAIPVLGLVGRNLIENSKDGRILTNVTNPSAPGYEALVNPTPTALVVQTNPDNEVVSATVLALGSGDRGGTVLLVPLDTKLRIPASGVDRLRTAATYGGPEILRQQIGDLLGIGFADLIQIGDSRWAGLTRPLGGITFDNPDTVTAADGTTFSSGTITLQPDQVGPFLAATVDGESDLNRLVRQQLFWRAWLDELKARGDGANLVPGEEGSGIGRYVRTLARGTHDVNVLAVNDNPDEGPPFVIDDEQARLQVAAAVPFPVGSYPGQRTRVRILNGVKAGPVPVGVTEAVVLGDGEITALGNADSFGHDTTTIEYYNQATEVRAKFLRAALGVGKLVFHAQPDPAVDVTVVVGKDAERSLAPRPTTTVPTTPPTSPDQGTGGAGSDGSNGAVDTSTTSGGSPSSTGDSGSNG